MFEFTNTAPTSDIIWEELKKQTIPSGLDPDLVRTMLWILLSAGRDFKKSKESAIKVINGETSPDKLRQGFRTALLKMKESTPIDVNPTHYDLPKNTDVVFNDCPELKVPILIFKDIFKDSNPDAVIELAERVFPVSEDMKKALVADLKSYQHEDVMTTTPYTLQMIKKETLFNSLHFRDLFKPDPNLPPKEVTTKTQLEDYLLERLIAAKVDGNDTTTIPTITKVAL